MRYVVVDLQGNQRERFGSHEELVSELREVVLDDPQAVRSLHVLEYDESGASKTVGRADEVLARAVRGPGAFLIDFVNQGNATSVATTDQSFEDFQRVVRQSAKPVAA